MDFDHASLVAFAKTFGLIYLMVMFLVALIYSFWPAKGEEFDRASRSVLDDEEGPCR